MEMTEMMKRFEEEMNWSLEQAKKDYKVGIFKTAYIKWLESQLTWKPASVKPEKEGKYWVICKWMDEDELFYCSNHYSMKHGWYDNDGNLIMLLWMPIQPLPDGLEE